MKIPSGLLTALQNANKTLVLTGAGMSAESGVPTFRDAQSGLWSKFRPEELATPEAFRKQPKSLRQRPWPEKRPVFRPITSGLTTRKRTMTITAA